MKRVFYATGQVEVEDYDEETTGGMLADADQLSNLLYRVEKRPHGHKQAAENVRPPHHTA